MSVFSEAAKRTKKPRPRLIDKRKEKNKTLAKDRTENDKVRLRSGGRCEVRTVVEPVYHFNPLTMEHVADDRIAIRCHRSAVGEPHHLISGLGRRNVGRSILAICKLAVCRQCHAEIHGRVLKPICDGFRYEAKTVVYERIK